MIADKVGAILMVDMAHFAGLVAGGVHPSPVPYADVVTTTTHKSLRGGPARGDHALQEKYAAAIDKAVFPGIQGGPHDNTTAAIAVALKEASTDAFKQYARQIVKDAAKLAETLMAKGYRLITNGTENHLMLVDLTNKGISGKKAARILDAAGIRPEAATPSPLTRADADPSGIRMGSAAVTSRGFKEAEIVEVGNLLDAVIADPDNPDSHARIAGQVRDLCRCRPRDWNASSPPESRRSGESVSPLRRPTRKTSVSPAAEVER